MPRQTRMERRARRLEQLEALTGGPSAESAAPSNAALAEEVRPAEQATTPLLDAAAAEVAPKAVPVAEPAAAKDTTVKPPIPAWAQGPHITGTLKEGSEGEDVKALQKKLGITESGTFDADTKKALIEWQTKNKLSGDGIAGGGTLGKMGLRQEFRSASHDENKFIPKYRATAYSESDMYRTKDDPYAVGAISRPTKEQDLGGKTYGTYQFESSVYRDGTKASDATVAGSTVMRFVNDKDNPYGPELQAIVKKHGVASAEFDTKWGELTASANGPFGRAQEKFLEKDKADEVTAWMERAKVVESARTDPELYDVVMGTVNQYGGLADGMADRVAGKANDKKPLSADDVGRALQDDKAARVESTFKSSPKAWGGIRERITREKKLFQ